METIWNEKVCKTCGKVFKRQKYDGPLAWGRRKYCSFKCYSVDHHAIAVQKRDKDFKVCEYCGEKYTPNYPASAITWASRKYCSRSCAMLGKGDENDALRTRICENCGNIYKKPKGMTFKKFEERTLCFQCHY